MLSFDIFVVLRLYKLLDGRSNCRWFEKHWRPCDVIVISGFAVCKDSGAQIWYFFKIWVCKIQSTIILCLSPLVCMWLPDQSKIILDGICVKDPDSILGQALVKQILSTVDRCQKLRVRANMMMCGGGRQTETKSHKIYWSYVATLFVLEASRKSLA